MHEHTTLLRHSHAYEIRAGIQMVQNVLVWHVRN